MPRNNGAWKAAFMVAALVSAVFLLVAADRLARGAPRTLRDDVAAGTGAADVSWGRADAPPLVVLVSLTCPHCRKWERDALPGLLSGPVADGRLRVVLRQFPSDRTALDGASVLACLPAARRFQVAGKLAAATAGPFRSDAATVAGLLPSEREAVAACSADAATLVEADAERARSEWGIAATPSFVFGKSVTAGYMPPGVPRPQ